MKFKKFIGRAKRKCPCFADLFAVCDYPPEVIAKVEKWWLENQCF